MRDQGMAEVYVTFLGSGDEKVMNYTLSSARVWPRRKKSERGQTLDATTRVRVMSFVPLIGILLGLGQGSTGLRSKTRSPGRSWCARHTCCPRPPQACANVMSN